MAPIDLESPIYQATGELNAKIAKAEESVGLKPTWYVNPNETLSDFFKRSEARMDLVEAAKINQGGIAQPTSSNVDSITWTGRRSIEEQKDIIRAKVPQALSKISELRNLLNPERKNNSPGLDVLVSLEADLVVLHSIVERDGNFDDTFQDLARTGKRFIETSDGIMNNIASSPTLLFPILLLLCFLLGWSPLLALAGVLKLPSGKKD